MFTKEFAQNYIEASYGPTIEQAHTLIVNGKKFVDAEELEEVREELMRLRTAPIKHSSTRLQMQVDALKKRNELLHEELSVVWAFVSKIHIEAAGNHQKFCKDYQSLRQEVNQIWEEHGEDNG
jgi:hypothetical protein